MNCRALGQGREIPAVSRWRRVVYPIYGWENWGLGRLTSTSEWSGPNLRPFAVRGRTVRSRDGHEDSSLPSELNMRSTHLTGDGFRRFVPCVTTGTHHTKLRRGLFFSSPASRSQFHSPISAKELLVQFPEFSFQAFQGYRDIMLWIKASGDIMIWGKSLFFVKRWRVTASSGFLCVAHFVCGF